MNLSKKILEKYEQSPDSEKVRIYLSGVYLLLSIQLEWVNEAEAIMHRYGVCTQDFKRHWNFAMKGMDNLEKSMKQSLQIDKREQFFSQFDQVLPILTDFIFNRPIKINKL